jgi:hypothetical protein
VLNSNYSAGYYNVNNRAQDILTADRDLQVISFLMPNGDIYMVEPYSRQQNLTANNFAFRD